METNARDIELIERFLDNDLSEEEATSFLSRIDQDPEFAKLFKLRNILPDVLADADNYANIHAEVKSNLEARDHFLFFFRHPAQFALAAVVLLLIATVIVFFVSSENGIFRSDKSSNLVNRDKSVNIEKGEEPSSKAAKDFAKVPFDKAVFNNTEKLIFKFRPSKDSTLQFVITLTGKPIIVYQRTLRRGQDSIQLLPGTFRPGAYVWHVGNIADKRMFIIK